MSGPSTFGTAAYGGEGWSQRTKAHVEEMGSIWRGGLDTEWRPLKTVLLRRPGAEIAVDDVNAAQQLEALDLARAQEEHDALAGAYSQAGVEVLHVPETFPAQPNRMFCADLFAMTREGAVLARPASTVRAGEEVAVAQALATARVPILRTLVDEATFEGADLMWLDPGTAILGLGLRTNRMAASMVEDVLALQDVDLIRVDMPFGTMHLMGMLRIADRDLAIAWPRRTPHAAVMALRSRGYRVEFLEITDEVEANRALNFVTLGPRKILMPAGNGTTKAWYESLGIEVLETPMYELRKAAGAVGCLTGVVARELA